MLSELLHFYINMKLMGFYYWTANSLFHKSPGVSGSGRFSECFVCWQD